MRKEVSYDEGEIPTLQSRVQASRLEASQRRWVTGKGVCENPGISQHQLRRWLTASAGLPGLDLPDRVGGSEWSNREMLDLFAQLGVVNVDFRDLLGGGHGRFLLEDQHRRYDEVLKGLAGGEEFVAIAITEEVAGSDIRGIKTVAEPIKSGYRINGRKLYNARLLEATRVILFATVPRGTPRKRRC